MRKLSIFLLIISFFYSIQQSQSNIKTNTTNKFPKIYCSIDKVKYRAKRIKLDKYESKNIINQRQLQTGEDEYQPIRIYLSTVKIEAYISLQKKSDQELYNKVFDYLNDIISYIRKLINIKPLHTNIRISMIDQIDYEVGTSIGYDTALISGVPYDLVIFPLFQSGKLYSEMLLVDDATKRTIAASISIPPDYFINEMSNKKFYIESLLLHEFTHILGFYNNTFQYFKGGLENTITKVEKRGIIRTYIKTPKVVELAKKYFACPSAIGIELEDQEASNISSHWDARILLGEYMNLEQYSPEVVISDFTLALLEDSGWYKVNYYTGGLMRFGKNKGCNFLDSYCYDNSGKTEFKNEFFDYPDNVGNPSCSSGRLSRTYCETKEYISFSNPIYERFYPIGGKTKNADYCFGFYNNDFEENGETDLYVGNCKNGNGNYGTQIQYNDYGKFKNGHLGVLEEKYSNNSFCILSEAYPTTSNEKPKYIGVVHPICYEMFCFNTLTIKIKDQYIVCPRKGGKVEVNGDFQGYIYCPDYNLICTGTVMCNDMFDCIEKRSVSNTSNYDYEFNGETSSQKISELKASVAIIGYELDDTGICPINCAQCKDNKKCFKCREGYNLIGQKENDNQPIKCDNQINILKGYYNINNVYYPCIDFCDKCINSNACITCDNFHKLNNDNTKCIDKVENCEEYNDSDFLCKKCKNGYAFIKEDRENCYIITDKEKYYTLDDGISYYPCNTNILNCDICNNNKDSCSKCKDSYYFLEDNRIFCYNNLNLTKYYSKDNGISYYLCNKSINNCESCKYENNQLLCSLCENKYYFIEDNRKECFNNYNLSKYYTEDEGKSYYPCSKAFSQCEICNNNKNVCSKCYNGFFFIGLNKEKCETISDLNKYYTEDNGISYIPCDSVMDGCDECNKGDVCNLCKTDYYFIENQRNKCYYKINFENFYKEGDAYFPCNKSIEYCNKCNVKDTCQQCNTNYYFIANDRKKCETGKDLKKYYTNDNGISYFLCSTTMENCDECYNDHFCYLCKSSYFLKFDDNKECFLESDLKKDKTYYRLNSTHYKKCSDNIKNCDICSSGEECDQCLPNNYFLNDNYKVCVNIIDINIEEYYEYDKYNYHSCSWFIENCKKCNSTMCNFCFDNYTLVNDNYKKCHPKENLKIGYYQNPRGNMYYSCIDNCDICVNGIECIECASNYSLLGDRTSCGSCMILELIIKDELTRENIDLLVQSYINNYKDNYDVAAVYSNPTLNYTLTIYRTWQCTELLLKEQYYRINTGEFIEKLKKKLNKSGNSFIFYLLNANYKSYFEVYDIELKRKIDIEEECPECVRVEYEIKNNYTAGINHILGTKLSKLAHNYNINVLNSSDIYFHEICKNLELQSIDLPIEQRRDIFFLGTRLKKIACLDDKCTINSILYNESIGICTCKLNLDFQKLLNNNSTISTENNLDYELEQSNIFTPVSGINPLPIFTCSKETFDSKNISSNVGLYIGCIVILIQLICFLYLLINYCIRKKIIKNIASPPPKEYLTLKKKAVFTDDNQKETQSKDNDYDEYYDSADSEKKVQDKDEEEFEDETDTNNYINSKINTNTKVVSDENSINSDGNKDLLNSKRSLNFNSDEIKPDDAEKDFSKISEIKKNPTDEQNDYSNLSKKTSNHSLDISEDEIFTLIKNVKDKLELDYINLDEAIKKDNRTFCELYIHLLPLKQPIWDMLSDIKALEINKSFVPLSMKIIRFFFMLSFNMFMNSLFLTQNYFNKKYTYFNNKYNLQYNEEIKDISSTEKFVYTIKNTYPFYISIFVICLLIQFIINYYLFNLRKQVWIILKECNDDRREEIKEMNLFMHSKKCLYIIVAFINFIFIIVFYFYIVNFTQAFKGGIIDYIGATFMTWLCLQFIPFISCLISALFRYMGLKNQNIRLYKLNQVYIY